MHFFARFLSHLKVHIKFAKLSFCISDAYGYQELYSTCVYSNSIFIIVFYPSTLHAATALRHSLRVVARPRLRDVGAARLLNTHGESNSLLGLGQLAAQLWCALASFLATLLGELSCCQGAFGFFINGHGGHGLSCCSNSCATMVVRKVAGELGMAHARGQILLFGKLSKELGVHLVSVDSRTHLLDAIISLQSRPPATNAHPHSTHSTPNPPPPLPSPTPTVPTPPPALPAAAAQPHPPPLPASPTITETSPSFSLRCSQFLELQPEFGIILQFTGGWQTPHTSFLALPRHHHLFQWKITNFCSSETKQDLFCVC